MARHSREFYEFQKKLKHLKTLRGQGTELISVYIPPSYNVNDVVAKLRDEMGQASNIKSKQTRKNVQSALERILHMLKGVNKPPENGVAIFAGSIDNKIEVFTVVPPEDPIPIQTYRCDSTFLVEPLERYLEAKDQYGIVVMDRREATLAIMKGKQSNIIKKMHSTVPGKHHKGGQCLHEDTLIQRQDGVILPLKHVKAGDVVVSSDNVNFKLGCQKCEQVFSKTSDEAYIIRTTSPQLEINTTPEHYFFTLGNTGIRAKQAADIEKGDMILSVRKIYVNTGPVSLQQLPLVYRITNSGREQLISKRKSLKMLQRDAAEKAGIAQATLSNFEIGKADLLDTTIERILAIYGLDKEDFFSRYVTKYEPFIAQETLTSDLVQLVGYMLVDGNLERNRIRLYEGDKQVAGHYCTLVEKTTGLKPSMRNRPSKGHYVVSIHSLDFRDFLVMNFPELEKKSKTISVPEKIMRAENRVLKGFLRGLFDGEGYVNNRKTGDSCRGSRICLAMANELMIKQIQLLLLRFGIISSVISKPNYKVKAQSNQFEIDISEPTSRALFKEHIGFASAKKQAKIKLSEAYRSTTDQVPVSGRFIKELLLRLGFKATMFQAANGFLNGHRNISFKVYNKNIVSAAKKALHGKLLSFEERSYLNLLEKIGASELMQVEVKEKQVLENPTGKYWDLAVPATESFVANNLVVHNSALRFDRLIEEQAELFFKEIAESMNEIFADEKITGIILGGSGPTKHAFAKNSNLHNNITAKFIGIVDTGYTDEFGIQEAVNMSEGLIKDLEIHKEMKLVEDFIAEAAKKGLAVYGEEIVKQVLLNGQAKLVLLSEDIDWKRATMTCTNGHVEEQTVKSVFQFNKENHVCKECNAKQEVELKDLVDVFIELAEQTGAEIEIISTETEAGRKFLQGFGGIGAMLRYK
ncbi:MAG: helix-turn-helix domain-containing protein [DPANN group archaeon]|nr:helix-turn-helix domain-containing protein [DPANN group archaeon]